MNVYHFTKPDKIDSIIRDGIIHNGKDYRLWVSVNKNHPLCYGRPNATVLFEIDVAGLNIHNNGQWCWLEDEIPRDRWFSVRQQTSSVPGIPYWSQWTEVVGWQ